MQVKITDNSEIFLKAKDQAVAFALEAIGLTAERHAKERCPVDTGRLRNSITHATKLYSGRGSYSDKKGNLYDDATARGEPEKNAVYIGSNVEYAKIVETSTTMKHTSGSAHFLRDAAATHGEEYKRIAEIQLKKA